MNGKNNIIVRRAEMKDIPFLITAIIEADKSGTPRSSYCSLLNIDELRFGDMLEKIFQLKLGGFEFCVSSFCLLECNNEPIGASASWIEHLNEIPSWQNRMLSIRETSSPESYSNLLKISEQSSNLIPPRSPLALQIESVYIVPDYRGGGLFKKMLDFHIYNALKLHPELNNIELVVYDNNIPALKAYSKLGFEVTQQSKLSNPEISAIFPSDGMVLISKNI
jgi:GNAT superfamily N-acetyltransferase